jgi:hypothetical protein
MVANMKNIQNSQLDQKHLGLTLISSLKYGC